MANISSSNSQGERVPKLRFRDHNGNDYPQYQYETVGTLFLHISHRNTNMVNNNVITNSAEYGLIPQREFFDKGIAVEGNTDKYYIIEQGDFVYNPRKSTTAPYGPFNCYQGKEEGIVSPLYTCLKPLHSDFTDYLLWYFRSSAWYSYIYHNGAQSGARHDRVGMTSELMDGIPINLPCLAEQTKVSRFLSLVEERIAKQRQLVESLKLYKRGLANDIFSQRIALYGERDEWTMSPLGEVVTINPKTGPLPDEFIYLDLECVNSGKVCAVNTIKRENAPSRAQRLLEKNDVLYQMVRPYQRNNYYYADTFSSPVVATTGYAQIKCGACDPLFVYEQISSEQFAKEAMLRSTGTSYPAINADDLGEIPFFLPSLHTQKKIGAFLSLVNQKIFESEEELQLLESIKSSLLQQLFI